MSQALDPDPPVSGRSGKIAGYRLDKYLGQGSMAAVYLAQDRRLHRPVALKVLAPDLARDAAFRTSVIRESRAAAAVDHQHIIPVYDADEANGTVYVAMRYVRGGDARSLLNRRGPLPFGHVWHIMAQIASALDAAHAHGLVHRDVRPGNILLDASDTADGGMSQRVGDGEFEHAYLSDFGMSKGLSPGQIIATGQFTGTLDYAAPEHIEGDALDGRADLYSLACTAFELLSGAPPFGPDQGPTLMYAQLYALPPSATARRAELPAAVDLVLATALAKNPADRYPSCGRFAGELRAALGLQPGEPADPPQSRSPGRTGLARKSGLAAAERSIAADKGPAAGPGPLDPDATDELAGPDPELSAQRPRARRPILAATVAVVVVAVAAASGVALSKRPAPDRPAISSPAASSPAGRSRSPSPAAAPSPQPSVLASRQAAALSTLLTSSAAARTALHEAVSQVGACTNLSGAVSQLHGVVNQRASEYGRASALATSALPDGTKVKSELITALSTSLKADREYLAWAQQQLDRGCTPSDQSSAYNAALSASQLADAAKAAFVQVWNPVAARYGAGQNSPRDI
ncbi:MAG: serine/threonine-protein kinase [Streptosporangiaceae bacterium]